ncbi:MAG TPA: hypothetical protein VEX38_09570, partial [Fimbriimonadaceae bacterium]|nr:hypothetical protein [Fimbriimonadaceae bacterium]
DTAETRFWKAKALSKRDTYGEGNTIHARIKTDSDPPQLREAADKGTWQWLDGIRKGFTRGVVDKIDTKYLIVKFEDGSSLAYRATDKSDVRIKSKPDATLRDVTPGMTVYAKGRTLPTLDTFLVEITDSAPVAAAPKTKTSKKVAKPAPLAATGTLQGKIGQVFENIAMFDLETNGRKLHITYNMGTLFLLDGKAAKKTALSAGQTVSLTYKRDKAGRIIALKVELSSGSG